MLLIWRYILFLRKKAASFLKRLFIFYCLFFLSQVFLTKVDNYRGSHADRGVGTETNPYKQRK
jgi:hypothetical protein